MPPIKSKTICSQAGGAGRVERMGEPGQANPVIVNGIKVKCFRYCFGNYLTWHLCQKLIGSTHEDSCNYCMVSQENETFTLLLEFCFSQLKVPFFSCLDRPRA